MEPTKHTLASIEEYAKAEFPHAFSLLPPRRITTVNYTEKPTKAIHVGYIRTQPYRNNPKYPVFAYLESLEFVGYRIINWYKLSDKEYVSSERQNDITFSSEPFYHLPKGDAVRMDLVTSLVMYYFVAGGALPVFEEKEGVTLALFREACEVHARAVEESKKERAAANKKRDEDEEVEKRKRRREEVVSSVDNIIKEKDEEIDKYKALLSQIRDLCDASPHEGSSNTQKIKRHIDDVLK